MTTYTVGEYDSWDNIALANDIPTSWLLLANGADPAQSPPPLTQWQEIYLPDPPPTAAVAPDGHNVLHVGPGGFADIEFEHDDQVMTALDFTAGKLGQNPISFHVVLGQEASRTTLSITDEHDNEIFSESHEDGDFVEAGLHKWKWDGFSTAGVFDTRQLRSTLKAKLVTLRLSDNHPITSITRIRGVAEKAKYAEVKVNRTDHTIEATVYIKVDKPGTDGAMIGTAIAAPIVAGVVGAVAGGLVGAALGAGIGAAIGAGHHHSGSALTHDATSGAETGAIIGAIGLGAAAAAAVAIAEPVLFHHMDNLTDEQVETMKTHIIAGIGKHWTRDGVREDSGLSTLVAIDGVPYHLRTRAEARADDVVVFTAMREVQQNQRPCNLGAVVSGMPILIPFEWLTTQGAAFFEETAAHEFGHSVLRDERDHDYSITHKGSTGGMASQDALVSQPSYPVSGEIDLMQYWNPPGVADATERSIVAEAEARGLVSVAQIKFSRA